MNEFFILEFGGEEWDKEDLCMVMVGEEVGSKMEL